MRKLMLQLFLTVGIGVSSGSERPCSEYADCTGPISRSISLWETYQ